MSSILLDEMLETMIKIISNLYVDTERIRKNTEMTKGQIFAEFVLDALIKKGIPRLSAYRDIQRVAFAASDADTEFLDAIKKDPAISSHLSTKEIKEIFVPENHLGAADKIINNVYKKVQKNCSKFT